MRNRVSVLKKEAKPSGIISQSQNNGSVNAASGEDSDTSISKSEHLTEVRKSIKVEQLTNSS